MAFNGNGADNDELLGVRSPSAFTESERQYSTFIRQKLERLLKGELNRLPLLRQYHREEGRLGVLLPQVNGTGNGLNLPVIRTLMCDTLRFLHTGQPGGPIAQQQEDGRLIEVQPFTTRFPHILIERRDVYDALTGEALETEWTARRTQNAHADVRINRALDAANLGVELMRSWRKEG
jgi:hypothetical protein